MTERNKPNEIRLTRIYDAPVNVVWDAWVDPDEVSKWWGPRGFTLTTHSKDVRAGGSWAYTMHGPDGTDFPNHSHYLEVEKHKRLVYDHGGAKDRPPMFRVTVTFDERGGKTVMDMTMGFSTPEVAANTRKFIKKAGGDATWDRLAEYLAGKSGHEQFVINRSFPASLGKMFQMWTQPEHFAKWLPPTGFTMEFLRCEIREGGTSFYKMTNGTNLTMYGRVQYQEIRSPDRLVYTQQFADADEKISRHPLAPIWPETMHTVVALTAEGSDQTRVTVTWEPYGKCTPEELSAFKKAKPGMTQGWTGSFDKLESLLGGGMPET